MLAKRLMATTAALIIGGGAWAQDQSIIVQSTTSTANSGLYDYLLPIFQEETGIQVNVVAVGTGQAIKNAENCDGDVLLVHAKPSEEKFVAAGFGTERTDLMYNDFVIVGPAADPAGVGGMDDVQGALAKIAVPGDPGQRALHVLHATDTRRIGSGAHDDEVVIHQVRAFGAEPGGDECLFRRLGMHQQHITIAILGVLDRLARAHGHDIDLDAGCLLENR